MPNHRARIATRVPKGMAAEEPSTQRIRFIRKKSANTILRGEERQREDNDKREATRENNKCRRYDEDMSGAKYRST